jgi:hypothetical protein
VSHFNIIVRIIAGALLVVAFTGCAHDETRSAVCHTHKVANGELTECR